MISRETRPDTRLAKSRAGGQGPYLRSPDYLGRSSEVKEVKPFKQDNRSDEDVTVGMNNDHYYYMYVDNSNWK